MHDIYAILKLKENDLIHGDFNDRVTLWISQAVSIIMDVPTRESSDTRAGHRSSSGHSALVRDGSGISCSARPKKASDASGGTEFRAELFGVVQRLFQYTENKEILRATCPVPCAEYLPSVVNKSFTKIRLDPMAQGTGDGVKPDPFVFQVSELQQLLEAVGATDAADPVQRQCRPFALTCSVEIQNPEHDLRRLHDLLKSVLENKSMEASLSLCLLVNTDAESINDAQVALLGDVTKVLRALGSPPPPIFQAASPYRNLLSQLVAHAKLERCRQFLDLGLSLDVADYPYDGNPSAQADACAPSEVMCPDHADSGYLKAMDTKRELCCAVCLRIKSEQQFYECPQACGWIICLECNAKARETIKTNLHKEQEGKRMGGGVPLSSTRTVADEPTLLGCVIQSAIAGLTAGGTAQEDKISDLIAAIMRSPLAPPNMAQGAIPALSHPDTILMLLLKDLDPNVMVYLPEDMKIAQKAQVQKRTHDNVPQDDRSRPLLHVALLLKKKKAMQVLIENGADLDTTDWKGRPLLHMLTKCAEPREEWKFVVDFMEDLKNKMDEEEVREQVAVQLAWHCGVSHSTPLHWACRWRNARAVKLLLDMNASLDEKDCFGETPLFSVIRGPEEPTKKKKVYFQADMALFWSVAPAFLAQACRTHQPAWLLHQRWRPNGLGGSD